MPAGSNCRSPSSFTCSPHEGGTKHRRFLVPVPELRQNLWHLGDFVWGKGQHAAAILARLNGQKHFVWGNHDHSTVKRLPEWVSSQPYAEIRDGQDFVVLSHYGHRVWNKAHYGAFHLFGHSHGSLPPQGRSHDVGTNVWDYRPVVLAEVKERLDALGLLESYGIHHG